MSWCPIFPTITASSVWRLPGHIFKAWIAILTHKDHDTHVWRGNAHTLSDTAKITVEQARESLIVLSSPDEASLSKEEDGKRVVSDDGEHWFVVNGKKYQDLINQEIARANARARTAKWRASKKKEQPVDTEENDRFDEFWRIYPKREAKPRAMSAWNKVKPAEVDKILKDVCDRAVSEDWTKENRKFVPMPASYLNARRWEDEASVAADDPNAPPPKSDWKAYEAWAMKQAVR